MQFVKTAHKLLDNLKTVVDSQFACPGAESRADLCWSLLTSAAIVLWAYPFPPVLCAA
jgi:hypothetical protein